ncbi:MULTISPECIES: mannose-6-phosphate isomerase, class I [unclassified Microbacterium]|uniref:mannose-6-phosphate isomerase, class I n=1 Tax=unclassified Microbacterium TaxID=2609290 RepID=UPI00214C2C06|nr:MULTISPECIES: mannose-6-phosphate isomerase, class I [unclassified Microbacterium]MCR2810235.1 mannose-6-phosphate isomerase, class I [Microbacterium sp. zg.B185]WIM19935.1 mannose-6-phosphate isomerase, class I [Microbacterium sp. zg-B185]
MLVPLANTPRDYDWGSVTLLAGLEGRDPSGRPEAEVWFGDHPGSPALVPDGRPLGVWLAEEGARTGAPAHLPYLLKLLAAASPLSIQAHPSRAQAVAGFAKEEAAGVPRDAAERTYRDENHKPELIVALSETFTALAGLREIAATRRLLQALGPAAAGLAARLNGPDAAAALRDALGWLLSGRAQPDVEAIIAAAATTDDAEFGPELARMKDLAARHPGDPGVVVAMLMNLVTLHRGEAVFIPAGVLHAYLEGLGVEVMAASDNVLRGGLTAKHIDVAELLDVLDSTPGPIRVLRPQRLGGGAARYETDVADFALLRVSVAPDGSSRVPVTGTTIALATKGVLEVRGNRSGEAVELRPGQALLVTPDEQHVILSGYGELFLALPGSASAGAGGS